jgi:hypothetical protein
MLLPAERTMLLGTNGLPSSIYRQAEQDNRGAKIAVALSLSEARKKP